MSNMHSMWFQLSNLTTLLSLVSVTLATPTTSTFPRLSSHCTDPQLEKLFGLPLPVQTVSLLSRDVLAVCASRPLETGNVSSVLHDMCVGPLTRVSRSQSTSFFWRASAYHVLGKQRMGWASCFTPCMQWRIAGFERRRDHLVGTHAGNRIAEFQRG